MFVNGDPLPATPVVSVCYLSPKCVSFWGICLVFVVVWPAVDINIPTDVQSTGASKEQVSAALLG